MNKLKNIGISALAGTLVSLSAAQAGGVSVSGSYELSYTQLDHEKVSGNKLGVNKNMSFGASGDLSDGGGVTWASNVAMSDSFGLSSASLAINMGGIATLTYDSGAGGTGANAVDNIVPTAWEEVDYGFSTGISDVGAVSASKGVVNLTVKAPTAGTGFSLSYASRMGSGHISDSGVGGGAISPGYKGLDVVVDFIDYSAAHAGFRFGVAGQVELANNTCANKERNAWSTGNKSGDVTSCSTGHKHKPYAGTSFTKIQLGPIHLGAQATFKNLATTEATAIMNQRSVMAGAAAVFGDTLSLSYGIGHDKYRYNDRNRGQAAANTAKDHASLDGTMGYIAGTEEFEYSTNKYRGWSAALNLGPVALKGTHNKVKGGDVLSAYVHDTTHTEFNLSIAF